MGETQLVSDESRARELLGEMTRGVRDAAGTRRREMALKAGREHVRGHEKKLTFDSLLTYMGDFPQIREGKVVYVIVKGFARELLVLADKLEPFNPAIPIKSKMRAGFKPSFLDQLHGDIDVVYLNKEHLRILWANWRRLLNSGTDIDNDSSVRTFAAFLLGIEDFTEPQLYQDKLDRYYCLANVSQSKFVVPRPEVMLLEYKDYSSDQPFDAQKGFLSDLLGRYEMDMGLLAELIDKHEEYSEKVWNVKKLSQNQTLSE